MFGLLANRHAELYRTLAHPARLKILRMLVADEQSVCQLCQCLNKRQSNVSQHLQVLKKRGLVYSQKVGKQRHYQIRRKYQGIIRHLLAFKT